MNVRVLDDNLLRELLQNGAGENEGKRVDAAGADELAEVVDSLRLEHPEESDKSKKNLQDTLSCVEDLLAFIDSKKKLRTKLSGNLEELQSELVQSTEMVNDAVDLISELKEEEEDTNRFCLPGDIWLPFTASTASGDTDTDQLGQEMSRELWGEASLQEIRSCATTKARVEALLGVLMKQHGRERELAEMRHFVSNAERKELEKLANSIRPNSS
jgi:hypothetical protein